MHLMIVSGRSGSGKTVALTTLEDLGFYCVDNLPVDLLMTLADKLHLTHENIAVSIDARNLPKEIASRNNVLTELKRGIKGQCDILYLDAEETVLLKRFSETRRKHPLTNPTCSLQEAISYEKKMLSPFSDQVDDGEQGYLNIERREEDSDSKKKRIRACRDSEFREPRASL